MDYHKITCNIQPRDPWVDIFINQFGELGCDSFEETKIGFNAYIPSSDFNSKTEEKIKKASQIDHCSFEYSIEKIPTKNWNEVWESSFEPILVENWCAILAPFHQNTFNTKHSVVIEPKMSFGTGHHETTFMMVLAMKELVLKDKDVLDMGSGTGVLAILAKKMESNYTEAIDIEEWAVENCVENAYKNNTEFIIKLGGKEQISDQPFDVILANINRNILIDQMSIYATRLKTGGKLLLSGLLTDDENTITDCANAQSLELTKKLNKENWLCLTFTKK